MNVDHSPFKPLFANPPKTIDKLRVIFRPKQVVIYELSSIISFPLQLNFPKPAWLMLFLAKSAFLVSIDRILKSFARGAQSSCWLASSSRLFAPIVSKTGLSVSS